MKILLHKGKGNPQQMLCRVKSHKLENYYGCHWRFEKGTGEKRENPENKLSGSLPKQ